MHTRLYSYLEHNHLLYPSQYGFRTRRSCKQAITELVRYILQSKNRNEHCASIFLDLSKAFDTLDHSILLQKLERYGVRGSILDWFASYLKDRRLVAKITMEPNQTVKSDSYNITYGAAQGSCLGPLLFIIFMNGLNLLPLFSNIILFTDDTTLFNSHRSNNFLKYTLEHDLKLMIEWFKANKLSLNLNKTVGIKFWDNKKPFSLHVDNMIIQMAEYTKFLGVYIDHKLNWHIHITNLLDRLNTNRCMLSLGRNLLDMACLRNVYYGHIHSHILYGILVWGSMASQCIINEIYKIQKQCIHIMRPAAQWRDILSIFKDLHMMTVHNMIQIVMCKLGHNISHKHFPTPIISLFDKFGGHKLHQYLTRNKHIPNLQ